MGRLSNRIRSKTSEPVGQSMYQGNPPAQPQGSNQNWERGRWSEPQSVSLSRGQPQQWGGGTTYVSAAFILLSPFIVTIL